VLYEIQSIQGDYYLRREELNRDLRNKKAFIEDIGKTLPAGYDANKWRAANLREIHTKISIATNKNKEIEADKLKLASIDAQISNGKEAKENNIKKAKEKASANISTLNIDIGMFETQINKIKQQIVNKQEEKNIILAKTEENIKGIEENHKKKEQEIFDIQKQLTEKTMASSPVDISPFLEEAETIERMKGFLNEHARMISLQSDVEQLKSSSGELTAKIEKARILPSEILKQCTIPIAGLTVVDGDPRINGLPISNLSDGEKLLLCVDIANEKKNVLNLLLIDGVEKLCTENREALYAKCKAKGVRFIATRTTDDPELTIIEM
jgi:DNA repair exonuclease SbcCD ATPase subunit